MMYVIWSHKHDSWWRPDRCGYTRALSEAGRYSAIEAGEIVVPVIPCGIEVAVPEEVALLHRTAHIFGLREEEE